MTWVRRAEDYAFFDNGGRPLAFAHRGGAMTADNRGIENSLAAFASAVELGYRYVETDVHATSDGVLLAFHDATLDRVTDRRGPVSERSHEEIQGAKIGGREPIPLLSDLLTTWPDLRINIDCKSHAAIAPLVRVVVEHGAWDRVCVASFSPWRLSRLRAALGPSVATSYTSLGVASLRLLPAARLRVRPHRTTGTRRPGADVGRPAPGGDPRVRGPGARAREAGARLDGRPAC